MESAIVGGGEGVFSRSSVRFCRRDQEHLFTADDSKPEKHNLRDSVQKSEFTAADFLSMSGMILVRPFWQNNLQQSYINPTCSQETQHWHLSRLSNQSVWISSTDSFKRTDSKRNIHLNMKKHEKNIFTIETMTFKTALISNSLICFSWALNDLTVPYRFYALSYFTWHTYIFIIWWSTHYEFLKKIKIKKAFFLSTDTRSHIY